ncbi:MAG: PH domain-containing protein [Bacteroidaceae bacterium]|nr:PH domain-containing protein [Bacteroidaceae bacterium]
MIKKKIFVDMDGVLVNFQSGIDKLDETTKLKYADDGNGKSHYDDVPGIFSLMEPMPGAIDAVRRLQKMDYDLYILSTAPWGNPSAWADKVAWVTKHLDDVFHKRVIITHCKDLLAANDDAFLIDDRTGHGASEFGGRHIQFGTECFPDWSTVVDFMKSNIAYRFKANKSIGGFPNELIIEDDNIIYRTFSAIVKFKYNEISSVSVDKHSLFSDIIIKTNGGQNIRIDCFSHSVAEKIHTLILSGLEDHSQSSIDFDPIDS